jgi:hypothetical protein
MAPRIIVGWDSPRTPLNHEWAYEYNKIIGQIELKISTDEDPQTNFDGHIFDSYVRRNSCIAHITYDINDQEWKCINPDTIRPRPGFLPNFITMEALADFMVAKVREIEAIRNV